MIEVFFCASENVMDEEEEEEKRIQPIRMNA